MKILRQACLFLKANWLTAAYLILAVVLLWCLCSRLDPDLGWHLRVGADIANGIFPRTDHFTFTFFGQPWVDHEWLAEIIMHYFWIWGGYGLLIIVCSVLWFWSFWKNLQNNQDYTGVISAKTKVALALAGVLIIAPSVGVRIQALTPLGLIILIGLFNQYLHRPTVRLYFLFPLIMLLWANLHGSFVYGLMAGGLFLLQLVLTNFSQAKKFGLAYLAGVAATLLNPYGLTLWHEVIINARTSALERINEWLPIYYEPVNYLLLTFLVVLIFLFIINRKALNKFPLYYQLLCLIILILAIASRRNSIVLLPLCLPPLVLLWRTDPVVNKIRIGILVDLIYLVVVVIVMIYQYPSAFKPKLTSLNPFKVNQPNYPNLHIVEKLNKLPSQSHVFASYDWGGYLVYQSPGNLYLIDGRNSSYWFLEKQPGLMGYQDLVANPDKFVAMINNYNVTAVLLGDYGSSEETIKNPQSPDAKKRSEIWLKLADKLKNSGKWQEVSVPADSWPMLFERK